MKMRANCNLDKFRPHIIACTITSPIHVTSILLKISEYGRRATGKHARFAEPNEPKDSGFDKRTATTNPKLGENRRRNPLLEITRREAGEKGRDGVSIEIWAALPRRPFPRYFPHTYFGQREGSAIHSSSVRCRSAQLWLVGFLVGETRDDSESRMENA